MNTVTFNGPRRWGFEFVLHPMPREEEEKSVESRIGVIIFSYWIMPGLFTRTRRIGCGTIQPSSDAKGSCRLLWLSAFLNQEVGLTSWRDAPGSGKQQPARQTIMEGLAR